MYLIVDRDAKLWAMCDECETLWDPLAEVSAESYLEDQERVDGAQLAREADVLRAGLPATRYRRETKPVRGP